MILTTKLSKTLRFNRKNETEFHGEQMKTLVESLSSKLEEFSIAEKNRENDIESMLNTLHQEQNQFNQSFEFILETSDFLRIEQFKELIERQQQGYDALMNQRNTVAFSAYTTNSQFINNYEALMEKRTTVAFSAYTTTQQIITSNTNIKIEKIWTNIGMDMIQVPGYLLLHVKVSITLPQFSVGSDSESLFSCSKFDFEEKLLEKLVRFEHKMQLNEIKLKKWEDTFSSKLDKMEEAIKRTEIFVETMLETQLQEQSRLNDSFQEIIDLFKFQTKNETKFHEEQINTLLKSLSSKTEEISDAEKNRETALELMQNTLHQDQNRFNKSFDLILEKFRLSSNKSINELIAKQQKDYEAIMEKRTIAAFSAYTTKLQTITRSTNVKFEKVWTNIGNGYNPSTGIFTAPRQGVYHITAVVMSVGAAQLYLHLKRNNEYTAGSFVTGDGYKTGTFDVVLNLQKGDTISVGCRSSTTVYSDSDKYTTFSGHLIA
ncbi:C1QL [Mytilus edulis]|uniref:C1QL n=1 Tax=Mytilus edulis TaxID=6550 RepID=A0A8S3TQE3_MYTED|nr:C1QL [Mytilus edulis]